MCIFKLFLEDSETGTCISLGFLSGPRPQLEGPYGSHHTCAEESSGAVGAQLVRPYGFPLHVRTRARLNTYSCLAFWGLEG